MHCTCNFICGLSDVVIKTFSQSVRHYHGRSCLLGRSAGDSWLQGQLLINWGPWRDHVDNRIHVIMKREITRLQCIMYDTKPCITMRIWTFWEIWGLLHPLPLPVMARFGTLKQIPTVLSESQLRAPPVRIFEENYSRARDAPVRRIYVPKFGKIFSLLGPHPFLYRWGWNFSWSSQPLKESRSSSCPIGAACSPCGAINLKIVPWQN